METFSALLALCEGNPPATGGFPSQRPLARGVDIFFDLPVRLKYNGWVNIRDAGDLGRHRAHYDSTLMIWSYYNGRQSTHPRLNAEN